MRSTSASLLRRTGQRACRRRSQTAANAPAPRRRSAARRDARRHTKAGPSGIRWACLANRQQRNRRRHRAGCRRDRRAGVAHIPQCRARAPETREIRKRVSTRLCRSDLQCAELEHVETVDGVTTRRAGFGNVATARCASLGDLERTTGRRWPGSAPQVANVTLSNAATGVPFSVAAGQLSSCSGAYVR
jgi:hypothetical protein